MPGVILFLSGTGFGFIVGAAVAIRMGKPSRTTPVQPFHERGYPFDLGARASIDADVKSRAAKEVAEIIAEHVPGEWWDAVKSNLYAAGAKNVADALTNITGQSIMDRRYS